MIDFVICTVDRPRNYIHKVISALPKSLPINLVVGSPKYEYLQRYRTKPRIQAIGVDPREWEEIQHYGVEQRASWNYWRCFEYGIRPGIRKGLVILEDDVLPANGWQRRLRDTIAQIESQYGQEYALALYTCYSKLPRPRARGLLYASYPAHKFCGTQAMFYSEPVRTAYSQYLRQEGVESFRKPYDILLNEYLRFTGIPLFVTTPCLFEHIGEISTGLCLGFHRAGVFKKTFQGGKQKVAERVMSR